MEAKKIFLSLLLATMMCVPFTASAQVTIGSTDLPQATLDIRGAEGETGRAFRLIDGNHNVPGRVLTLGENGIGTWVDVEKVIAGNVGRTDIGDFFIVADGWEIINQATFKDNATGTFQFRIEFQNTVPINFNANHRTTNNALIATMRAVPRRWIQFTAFPSNAPGNFFEVRASSFNFSLIQSLTGETLPENTRLSASGIFMGGPLLD